MGNLEVITVGDYLKGGTGDRRVFIETFYGLEEVARVDRDFYGRGSLSVYCPKSNGGFGFNYAVHVGTPLLVER